MGNGLMVSWVSVGSLEEDNVPPYHELGRSHDVS